MQARILLFHGQSGAGKTHLIRALRTRAHRAGKAYFGYAQMTPDVANYADYYLRRLVASLEKPYDPDQRRRERARAARPTRLVGDAAVLDPAHSTSCATPSSATRSLAKLVLGIADQIVAAPKFAGQNLDINIVRALLYLQRSDPRIDQRVRQYLYGHKLNDLSQEAVAALDPNTGEGRAFEIIESLGRLMWTVDRAALVFAIDQVEDLRFFDDYHGALPEGGARPDPDRQPRADLDRARLLPRRLLRQGARGAGAVLHRPHREGGPGAADRDAHRRGGAAHHRQAPAAGRRAATAPIRRSISARSSSRSSAACRRGASWSWRRRACASRRAMRAPEPEEKRRLHLDAGRGARLRRRPRRRTRRAPRAPIEFRDHWDRFTAQSEAEIPADDQSLMDVLAGALALAQRGVGRRDRRRR